MTSKNSQEITKNLIAQTEQEVLMAELTNRVILTETTTGGAPAGATEESKRLRDRAKLKLRHLREMLKELQDGKLEI